jgi:ferredoxin-NADP reductase
MQANTFDITLEEAYMLSPQVKHFVFTPVSPIEYTPGHFITFHIELDGKTLRRSYSIANAPRANGQLELAAGFVENGPGTQLLFNLKPGDRLKTTGPFGRLTLKDENPKRYIFMATSTGITPYRAMLPELTKRLEADPELHVVILQGVQTRADLLYHDEFIAWAKTSPRATYRAQLSRENASELREDEHAGYVQSSFSDLNPKAEEDLVYLCGNPGMVDDAFSQLKELGFTVQRIVREKYISR